VTKLIDHTEPGCWNTLPFLCCAVLPGFCIDSGQVAAASELTTSQTTHGILSHQVFDLCSSPFCRSLSEIVMNLDLPDVQIFPGISSSVVRWPWKPFTLGTPHPILYLTCYLPVHPASYTFVQAGPLS